MTTSHPTFLSSPNSLANGKLRCCRLIYRSVLNLDRDVSLRNSTELVLLSSRSGVVPMESFLANLAVGITVRYLGAGTWRNYLGAHHSGPS